jgi:hypothetical protein
MLKRNARRLLDDAAHPNQGPQQHPVVLYVTWLGQRTSQAQVAALVQQISDDPDAARECWVKISRMHRWPTGRGRPPTFDDVLRFFERLAEE